MALAASSVMSYQTRYISTSESYYSVRYNWPIDNADMIQMSARSRTVEHSGCPIPRWYMRYHNNLDDQQGYPSSCVSTVGEVPINIIVK